MRPVHRTLLALALTSQGLTAAYAQRSPLVRDGIAAADPQVAAEIAPYLASPAIRFTDWLGDGSMLVSLSTAGVRQIEHLSAPRAEGPTGPATASILMGAAGLVAGGVVAAAARPYTSDAFVYVTRPGEGGGAAAPLPVTLPAPAPTPAVAPATGELYLQAEAAAPRLLAPTRLDVGAPSWAHDGKRIAYTGAGDSGVYVLDTASVGASPQPVSGTEGLVWRVLGWSIDDGTLLLGRLPQSSDDDDAEMELYLADVHSGALVPVPSIATRARASRAIATRLALGPDQGVPGEAAQARTARFASDGRTILLVTRTPCERGHDTAVANEFLQLCSTDPTSGEWHRRSAPATSDVELFDESADGSWLAYTLNEAGASRLMLVNQHLKLDAAVESVPTGILRTLKFDPTGKRLALTLESPRTTPDVYVLDVRTHVLARWTDSETPLGAATFVPAQLVHFPTWDQVEGQPRQLTAWLYSPLNAPFAGAGPRPVVIWLCGGGGRECRPGYDPFIQYLVQKQGFVVLAPNVRGSCGFGSHFEALGAGSWRNDAVRDIGALLVWIGLQSGWDARHVALLGESYGSYLALASLAQFGDRLQGGVAAFPRHPWLLPNAFAIRRPVLLVQDLANGSVPAYQAAQLREALRSNGVAVEYLAATGESGNFAARVNSAAYHEAVATFLRQLLH